MNRSFKLIVTLLIVSLFTTGCSFNATKGEGSLFYAEGSVDVLNSKGTMEMGVGGSQADSVSRKELGSPYYDHSTYTSK